jgi:hypothetical protein
MGDSTGPKPRVHAFGYLDETGLLHSPATDKVFGMGLLLSPNTRELHRAIITLKNKRRYHRELKFSDVTSQTLPIYLELIDIFFACTNARFHVQIVDKSTAKVVPAKGLHQKAYNNYAASLIAGSVGKNRGSASEYVTILADDISTSKDDKFEKVIRERIRLVHRRNALFGIARLESHAVSEIQMVDVLLGTVAYAFKIKYGLVKGSGAQLRLLKHLQVKLGAVFLAQSQVVRLRNGDVFEVIEIAAK